MEERLPERRLQQKRDRRSFLAVIADGAAASDASEDPKGWCNDKELLQHPPISTYLRS